MVQTQAWRGRHREALGDRRVLGHAADRAGEQDELVLALPLRLMAFAPRTGEPLWTCDGPNIGAYSSPFHGEGLVAYAGRLPQQPDGGAAWRSR